MQTIIDNTNLPKKVTLQCHETCKEKISNLDTRPKGNAMFCKKGVLKM